MRVKGLYVVLNQFEKEDRELLSLCEQVLKGGADWVQYRDKRPLSKEVELLAQAVGELCHSFSIPFVVNDHIELAVEVGACGVHLGQQDRSVKEAREHLGPQGVIGVTVSSPLEAKKAVAEGACYLGCGHVFPTKTKKKKGAPIGLEGVAAVVEAVEIPVVAIGGVDGPSIPPLMELGVAGVAVVSALDRHQNPLRRCEELKQIVRGERR